ncbi:hypothetical protein PVAR5_5498 [Paecilomyces variotii No. 5]|uniref:Mediator of RNA polymerase II transcription subunit 9 n=1 Tax=Byssochlamys spectabilis (strain No. 5 / NBRC 109023) TaxID=1356009 RepID=V5FXK0_BYSSN|nr:hypothetical protein PVAR5_5498 [Paecilomyces variotii No. 5]
MASRSPVSGTPLAKGSSAPETPMSATTAAPAPFPSPQTFDFLPQLHALILRLLAAQTGSDSSGAGTGDGGDASGVAGQPGAGPSSSGPGQSQQQQPSNLGGAGANSSSNGSSQRHHTGGSSTPGAAALGPNAPPPLDVKDLPTAASAIKIRIQKARTVVEALPDVDRTVEDQSREIEELEDRISRLRKVIGEFGRRADGDQAEDIKMVT